MHFFSSDVFLTALARDYYRAKNWEFKTYAVAGLCVRLAELNGKHPAVSGPFYDYTKPLQPETEAIRGVSFVPKVVTQTVALADTDPKGSAPMTVQEPAPLIRWSDFGTWADYEALVRKRSKTIFSAHGRHMRKLANEQGEPTFEFADTNPASFDQCLVWKVRQYAGGHEALENRLVVEMLRRLYEEGILVVSTLKVRGKYVAAHAGVQWQRQHLSFFSSYDPAYAKYGVGKETLHRMLQHCHARGDEEFDFLQGAEEYKWDYATHLQIIEAVGRQPARARIIGQAQALGTATIKNISPEFYYGLKKTVIRARTIKQDLFHPNQS